MNRGDETMTADVLSSDLLLKMNAYWRAANYLAVGQIYLYDNPLLREPLKLSHVKPLVVGHWGTTPGQNFIYVHLNRVIKKFDLNMIYIAGPGHGGPALVANTYLEGSYSEIYPNISQDEAGLKKLFTQFSFPGGISSHVAPTTPGSSSPASLAMAKPRRGRWPPRGNRTSCSMPPPTAQCSPSCTSMATRSATPLF
jgi:xylulose-5-phosphate/fructose-6-phosphate phosphoketolase